MNERRKDCKQELQQMNAKKAGWAGGEGGAGKWVGLYE